MISTLYPLVAKVGKQQNKLEKEIVIYQFSERICQNLLELSLVAIYHSTYLKHWRNTMC